MISMIATVQARHGLPCVVKWTGKTGVLTGTIKTYCRVDVAIGDGVTQLPSIAKVCPLCEAEVQRTADLLNQATPKDPAPNG